MAERSPRDILVAGIGELGLSLPDTAKDALCRYLDLLARWNSAYNLTAVRDPQDMVRRHLLDSLAILPLMDANIGRTLGVVYHEGRSLSRAAQAFIEVLENFSAH